MKTKTLYLVMTLLLWVCMGYGQVQRTDTVSHNRSFDRFKQESNEDFNRFKTQIHEDFDRFLAEAWTEYQCFIGDRSVFAAPKPTTLPVPSTQSGVDPSTFTVDYDVRSIPDADREAIENFKPLEGPGLELIRFYGIPLWFHFPNTLRIKAESVSERDVARYYKTMSARPESMVLQQELESSVKRLGLNPWGYYLLLRNLSEKAFENLNDRVLFCFYMLHSNGFKARVGRGRESGQLILLLAIDNSKEVYSLPFYRFNGVKYYAVYGGQDGEDAFSYDEKADASGLRQIGLDFRRTLHLGSCDKIRRLHLAKSNLDLEIPFCTSQMRYYDDMPLTVFPVYFKNGPSSEARRVLDTTFNTMREHLSSAQMAEVLLDFVQNSFAYMIDEEQFGKEKYFFPEEVIGYPYSDCEDRCALFAWLVRTYADAEVVGILFPDHLVTGICFNDGSERPGKYANWNGKRYLLCDPTYPGASMGSIMPSYQDRDFEVIEIR